MATTWNSGDLLNVTLSGGNLVGTASGAGGVRSVASATSGKYYFELTTSTMANSNSGFGVANSSATLSSMGATPLNAAFVYNSGGVYINNVSQPFAISNIVGAVVGIAVDLGAKLLWLRNGPSGQWNGNNTTNNPATGLGGASISSIASGAIFAAFAGGASADNVTANFGASAFAGTVPSGFAAGFLGPTTAQLTQIAVEEWASMSPAVQLTQIALEEWGTVATAVPPTGRPMITMVM